MYISRELFLKMSVADLAIDVGIPKDSDEYDSFIGCVENILEYGCGYGDSFTEKIIEKCRSSQLDIAKKVISELERPNFVTAPCCKQYSGFPFRIPLPAPGQPYHTPSIGLD